MSHPHSRKTFFAKLLGLFAAAGVIPSLFAKTNKQQISPESGSTTFAIRKDERAVARTGDRL